METLSGEYAVPEDLTPSEAVVDVVASLERVDAIDLPPLYRTIDPDALDALVGSFGGDGNRVEFTYCGYQISLDGDGFAVRPTDRAASDRPR